MLQAISKIIAPVFLFPILMTTTLQADKANGYKLSVELKGFADSSLFFLCDVTEGSFNYEPAIEVTQLNDFTSFKKFKEEFLLLHLSFVTTLKLDNEKRVCFYDIGLAEGMLLDKLNPQWRTQYFVQRFFLEKYADELK